MSYRVRLRRGGLGSIPPSISVQNWGTVSPFGGSGMSGGSFWSSGFGDTTPTSTQVQASAGGCPPNYAGYPTPFDQYTFSCGGEWGIPDSVLWPLTQAAPAGPAPSSGFSIPTWAWVLFGVAILSSKRI